MTKNIKKGTPEWEKEIIALIGKEINKEFTKGQKKPDGTEVTAEKETIKVNDTQILLKEIKEQKKIVEEKLNSLAQKKGYKGEAVALFKLIKDLEPKIKDWKDFVNWYNQAHQRFLKGGTDGYGTGNIGWVKVLKTYLEQKYAKPNATSLTETYDSNLYQGTFRMGELGNSHTAFRITENEVVKLMARVVKELGKIKKTEFDAYVNGLGKAKLADGTWRPAADFTAPKVITWMDNIRDRAKHLVDNAIKGTMIDENGNKVEHPDKGKPANGYRLEYSFGDDYTDRSGNPVATNNFTHTELTQLFNLLKLFGDHAWVTHQNLQPALTEIKGATLILLPAEKEPMPSSKLKDFGIEGYIDNNGKSNFYATDYGTRISDGSEYRAVEYSWDSKFEVQVEDSLQDWANLINSFACEGYADEKNKNKLISSFTNDPIKQLFADLRSYDTTSSTATDKGGTGTDITPNAGIFSDGTYPYSYHEFPEFYLDEESRLESLKVNKEVITEELKSGRKELDQAEKDYQEDRKQLFAQEKELDDKINAKITELRKELKDKFKVSDTETNDFTGDNRITTIEHYNFQRLVRNLRFLAKNDEEAPTGKTNEDQAYSSSENICSQARSAWPQSSWNSIGWKDGDDEANQKRTNEERIAVIKENKDGKYDGKGLNWWHDCLVELEKLVKLSEQETKIKTALKAAIDNQTPAENLQDWRNTLQTIEADLATAFTDEKITKWKEKKDGQAKFDNLASLKTLLEKVCVKKADGTIEKVEDNFITALKKLKTKKVDGTEEEGQIDTLAKLVEKKDPVEVIKIITRYVEYDQLTDEAQKTKKQKLVWTLEKKDANGKYLDDADLTDEEITNTLYEIAIGKKTLATQRKVDETNGNENPNTEKSHWENYKWWYIGIGVPVLIAGVVAIFWNKIKSWWDGSAEEEGGGVTETEKEIEGEEDDDKE